LVDLAIKLPCRQKEKRTGTVNQDAKRVSAITASKKNIHHKNHNSCLLTAAEKEGMV